MQKLRDPNTIAGAVAKIIQAVGAEWCAAAVDRRERQIYNWSDSDSGQCPTVAQAMELDRIYEDAGHGQGPIGQLYAAKQKQREIPHTPECPNKRTADMAREFGEAVAYECELPDIGLISQNQHMRACKEWDDLAQLCEAKKRDLDARLLTPAREVSA